MVEGSLAGAEGMEELDCTSGMADRTEDTSERLGGEAIAGAGLLHKEGKKLNRSRLFPFLEKGASAAWFLVPGTWNAL